MRPDFHLVLTERARSDELYRLWEEIGARCYGAINLHEGKVGVGLVYATLIPDCGRAKMYADKLAEMVPGFIFQVRGAGTRKVYYEKAGKPEESV